MKDLTAVRGTLPLDARGHEVQGAHAESVQKVDVTTAGIVAVEVPDDALSAVVWATGDGAVTTIAFLFGGARAGAPATLAAVPTNMALEVSCAGAPYLYVQGTGAAADVWIRWKRRSI